MTNGKVKNASQTSAKLDVFKVLRTCVHDGTGLRTTVFFQGLRIKVQMVSKSRSA